MSGRDDRRGCLTSIGEEGLAMRKVESEALERACCDAAVTVREARQGAGVFAGVGVRNV